MENYKFKVRTIAFYLPQFHPIPENDEWWGKGFTEWTNVGKAKPLFKGHDQPKVPADLGYYDLRLSEVRREQAELARNHGIEGFCYWHYWFGKGKRLLEKPFMDTLSSGEPDFPFCLAWANHSWEAKLWNSEGVCEKDTLQEQLYLGEEDYIRHFNDVLPAFKDKRYMLVNNKPIFLIYNPLGFSDVVHFMDLWKKLAIKNGVEGIYFIGQTTDIKDKDQILAKGFDAVNVVRLYDFVRDKRSIRRKAIDRIKRNVLSIPAIFEYKEVMKYFVGEEDEDPKIIPTIIPNWDHTPRSGKGGQVFLNSTPELFGEHVKDVMEKIKNKPEQERITFIKSWNEWGEGNYLEPDLKYGRRHLEKFKETVDEYTK